jgi:hypothetical protein
MPSPSSSRAHSPLRWQTVLCARPVAAVAAYAPASSVSTVASRCVASSTNDSKLARSAFGTASSTTAPVARPITPATGGRSLSNVPCPGALFARRRGGSSGSSWRMPFSPAFWNISSASTCGSCNDPEGGKAFEGGALNAMAEVEQLPPRQAQLFRETLRAVAAEEPSQNQNELHARGMRARERRAGERGEDALARPTLVPNDRRSIPIMRRLLGRQRVPMGAAQTVRLQCVDQLLIAKIFRDEVEHRELESCVCLYHVRRPCAASIHKRGS